MCGPHRDPTRAKSPRSDFFIARTTSQGGNWAVTGRAAPGGASGARCNAQKARSAWPVPQARLRKRLFRKHPAAAWALQEANLNHLSVKQEGQEDKEEVFPGADHMHR